MEWYIYTAVLRGKAREVAQQMSAAQARGLGAVHAPGFDEEAAKRAGMVIATFARDGEHEARQQVTAEIPR